MIFHGIIIKYMQKKPWFPYSSLTIAQPVSIGQFASSMPRKVSWFHKESRRTLRRAPGAIQHP